jgi:hypothetical protein
MYGPSLKIGSSAIGIIGLAINHEFVEATGKLYAGYLLSQV